MMAELGENSLDARSVGSFELGDDLLEAVDDDSANCHEVDFLLDELAREVDAEGIEETMNSFTEHSSMASFSAALKESMAKFDEFLERSTSGSIHSSCHSRDSGELDELRERRPTSGISALVGKRSRDHFHGPLRHQPSDVTPVSIRTISGENLASMPMHRSYATTSALNSQATWRADYLNPSKENQTWDDPQPILGEVTGSKMRRLVSQNSYFNSRPSTGTEGGNNASWALHTDGLGENQRAAMQMLLSGPSLPGGRTKNAGCGSSSSGTQKMGRLTKSRASLRSLTLSTVQESSTVTPNASWAASKPAPGRFSIDDMQRIANAGSFPSHGTNATSKYGAKNVALDAPKSAFAGVSLEEMHRLANTGPSFSSQAASPTLASGTQNTNSGEWWQASKRASGNMTMEEVIRLPNMGTSPSSQTASVAVSIGTQKSTSGGLWQGPKPAFGNLTNEDMLRLAHSSGSFPSQGQAPKPAFGAVTMEEMLRLANANATLPQPPPNVSASAPQAFGSVTIEDMQRLARTSASANFPSQTAPATEIGAQAASGSWNASQSAWQTPTPAFGPLSLLDILRLANANAFMSSQTPALPSQAPTTPAFGNVSLENMQRLANTKASSFLSQGASPSFPSQTTMLANESGTQAVPQSATSNTSSWQPAQSALVDLTMIDIQRLSSAYASTNFNTQTTPIATASGTESAPQSATSNALSGKPAQSAFANLTMEDFQRLSSACASTNSPSYAAPVVKASVVQAAHPTLNPSSLQTPKPAFGNLTMEDFQRLAGASASANASFPTQTTPSTTESVTQAAPQSAPSNTRTRQTSEPAVGKFRMEEAPRLANLNVSGEPLTEAASTVIANESQHASSNEAWKPSARSVTVEEMQRRANANGPVASQPTPIELAKKTQGTHLDICLAPVKKLESSDSSLFNSQISPTGSEHGNEAVFDGKPPPQKVSGGHLQCLMRNNSNTSEPSGMKNMAWPDPSSNNDLPSQKRNVPLDLNADALLKKLQDTMKNSLNTQKALEEFDKARGLPRSHSQTMVNSSRSRKQLQEGKIIAKWDGSPLISQETELGKPKPRAPIKKSGATVHDKD